MRKIGYIIAFVLTLLVSCEEIAPDYPIEPVVDPNAPPPPGAESLELVVDPNLPPPPGAEPLKATPSLEPDAKNAVPSDTEEENAPEQPK